LGHVEKATGGGGLFSGSNSLQRCKVRKGQIFFKRRKKGEEWVELGKEKERDLFFPKARSKGKFDLVDEGGDY